MDINEYTNNKVEEIIQLLMHQNEILEKQTQVLEQLATKGDDLCSNK